MCLVVLKAPRATRPVGFLLLGGGLDAGATDPCGGLGKIHPRSPKLPGRSLAGGLRKVWVIQKRGPHVLIVLGQAFVGHRLHTAA